MGKDAIIVDLDGTCFDISQRLYLLKGEDTDWERFLSPDLIFQDKPIINTIRIIQTLLIQYEVIFITGRNEGIRWITDKQIQDNIGHFSYQLLMRQDGDHREDTVIKTELYNTHVKNNHSVVAVFEDKPSVVQMWRDLGLNVFAVAPQTYNDGF